jgi:hypothetical protein
MFTYSDDITSLPNNTSYGPDNNLRHNLKPTNYISNYMGPLIRRLDPSRGAGRANQVHILIVLVNCVMKVAGWRVGMTPRAHGTAPGPHPRPQGPY